MTMVKYVKLSVLCILIVTVFNMIGCSSKNKVVTKAVYLAPVKGGQLSKDEIEKYPEITIVTNMDELKKLATEKTAIWIDKDAVDILDSNWIWNKAQSKIPLVLVGYNNDIYSFREKLSVYGIKGPYIDWNDKKLEPGFSVAMLKEKSTTSYSVFMKGYDAIPEVKQILSLTNMLLEGKFPE